MGLTIHYQLHAQARSLANARELVCQLRQRALDLPFARIGPIAEFPSTTPDGERAVWWFDTRITGQEHSYRIHARRQFAFTTEPGDGCESASFGLGLFPRQILVDHPDQPGRMVNVRTGATGWRWSAFCKTQYAAHSPHGGVIHFLRCHLLVIRLLDLAQELGIWANVNDESGFWRDRDPAALARHAGDWDPRCGDADYDLRRLLAATQAAPRPPSSKIAGDEPCHSRKSC
jgi:hypothetical protein